MAIDMTQRPSAGARGWPAPASGDLAGEALATAAIMRNPQFQQLVRERSSFGLTLSIIMLVVYLAFIFSVAFAHDAMATKVGDTEISLGIVFGLAVIIFAFAMTGIYVVRANSRFDSLTRALVDGPGR